MLTLPRELYPRILVCAVIAARFGVTCTAAREIATGLYTMSITAAGAVVVWCGDNYEITTQYNVIGAREWLYGSTITRPAYIPNDFTEIRVKTTERLHIFDIDQLGVVVFNKKVYFAYTKPAHTDSPWAIRAAALAAALPHFSAEIYAARGIYTPFEENPAFRYAHRTSGKITFMTTNCEFIRVDSLDDIHTRVIILHKIT